MGGHLRVVSTCGAHLYHIEGACIRLEPSLMEGEEDIDVLLANLLGARRPVPALRNLHRLKIWLVADDGDEKIVRLSSSTCGCVLTLRLELGGIV